MKEFKKANVILLPVEKKTDLFLWDVVSLNKKLFFKENKSSFKGTYHHLYIISNDEIKEGDYGMHLNNQKILQFTKVLLKECDLSLYKKIIATTDSSLKLFSGELDLGVSLPQPSQKFIKKYVKEYNNINIITDVLVEYEKDCLLVCECECENDCIEVDTYIPFINPTNNSINIKKLKHN